MTPSPRPKAVTPQARRPRVADPKENQAKDEAADCLLWGWPEILAKTNIPRRTLERKKRSRSISEADPPSRPPTILETARCHRMVARRWLLMKDLQTPLDTAMELLLCFRLWPVALHAPGSIITTRKAPRRPKEKEPIGNAWGVDSPNEAKLRAIFSAHPAPNVGALARPRGRHRGLRVRRPRG